MVRFSFLIALLLSGLNVATISTTYAQKSNSWELKLGASGGLGVNYLRRSNLLLEGPAAVSFVSLPQSQLGESGLVNLYAEMLWRDRWGLSLGAEGNFLQLRQHVKAGSVTYIPADNIDWDQFTVPILFSRYFSVSSFPNKLKVSIGPELSYYDTVRDRISTFYMDEWLQISYARVNRINVGVRSMMMWCSQVSQRSNLNIGVGMNYDLFGPIAHEVAYYKRDNGIYTFDDYIGDLPEEELVYRITHTIRPWQYFFMVQWEVSLGK